MKNKEEWKRFLDHINHLSPWNLWQPQDWHKDIKKRKLNPFVKKQLEKLIEKEITG